VCVYVGARVVEARGYMFMVVVLVLLRRVVFMPDSPRSTE
jgi:hypothetical protein